MDVRTLCAKILLIELDEESNQFFILISHKVL